MKKIYGSCDVPVAQLPERIISHALEKRATSLSVIETGGTVQVNIVGKDCDTQDVFMHRCASGLAAEFKKLARLNLKDRRWDGVMPLVGRISTMGREFTMITFPISHTDSGIVVKLS